MVGGLRPGLLSKLALHAQRTTIMESRALDEFCKHPAKLGLARGHSVGQQIFSSLPLERILSVTSVNRVFLLVCVVYTVVYTLQLFVRVDGEIRPFTHYRFTNLESRGGATAPGNAGISGFGMMRLGEMKGKRVSSMGAESPCIAQDAAVGEWAEEGASMTLTLPGKSDTDYNMWYIQTLHGEGSAGDDSERFVLEGSDDAEAWEVVGASGFLPYYSQVVLTKALAPTPVGRGEYFVIDSHMSESHVFAFVYLNIIFYVGMIVSIVIAPYRPKLVPLAFQSSMWFQFVMRMIVAVVMHFEERGETPHHNSVFQILTSLNYALSALLLIVAQEWLECVPFLHGVVQLALQVNLYRQHHGSPGSPPLAAPAAVHLLDQTGSYLSWILAGLFVAGVRFSMIRKASRTIRLSKTKYAEVWLAVEAREREEIERLEGEVGRISKGAAGHTPVRQMDRPPAAAGRTRAGCSWSFLSSRRSSRVSASSSGSPGGAEKASFAMSLDAMRGVGSHASAEGAPAPGASSPAGRRHSAAGGLGTPAAASAVARRGRRSRSGSMEASPMFGIKATSNSATASQSSEAEGGSARSLQGGSARSLRSLRIALGGAPLLGVKAANKVSPSQAADAEGLPSARSPLSVRSPQGGTPLLGIKANRVCPSQPADAGGESSARSLGISLGGSPPQGMRAAANEVPPGAKPEREDGGKRRNSLDPGFFSALTSMAVQPAGPGPYRRFSDSLTVSILNLRNAGIIQGSSDSVASGGSAAEPQATNFSAAEPQATNFLCDNVLQSPSLYRHILACSSASRPAKASECSRRVLSLDQLHSQAFLVHDIFEHEVLSLARQHSGKFRLKQEPSRARVARTSSLKRVWSWTSSQPAPEQDEGGDEVIFFGEWDGSEESRGRFELGGIKSVSRCITKLDAAYGLDVSRLLDVCRETIYFDTVKDLRECLGSIKASGMFEVVRVKSTMRTSAHAREEWGSREVFAGFHMVKVNVKVVGSREARSLCVDTHVCELLLVLTDIGRVQSREWRANYREWRANYREWRVCKRAMEQVASISSRVVRVLGTPLRRGPEHAGGDAPESRRLEDESEASLMHSVGLDDQSAATTVTERGGGGVRQVSKVMQLADPLEPVPVYVPTTIQETEEAVDQSGGQTSWGLQLSQDTVDLLLGLSRMSALGLADFLDQRWDDCLNSKGKDQGFRTSSHSSLFYVSKPVTACVQRWPFQLFLLGVAAMVGIFGVNGALHFAVANRDYAFGPFQHYRLETTLTRNGTQGGGVLGPGVAGFGVIGLSGCTPNASLGARDEQDWTDHVPYFAGPVGSSFLVSYPAPRPMEGWYLRTGSAEGSEGADPAFFNVWATNDAPSIDDQGACASARDGDKWWNSLPSVESQEWCNATWLRVGAPKWRFRGTGQAVGVERISRRWWDFVSLPITLPSARGSLETFLLRPTTQIYIWYWVLAAILMPLPIFFTVVSGFLNSWSVSIWFLPPPHVSLSSAFAISFFCTLVSGCLSSYYEVYHMTLEQFTNSLPLGMMALTCFLQDDKFVWGFWAFAVLSFGSWAGVCAYVWHNPFARASMTGIMVVFFSAFITIMRKRDFLKSKNMLKDDKIQYDALWNSLYEGEDSRACIEHLEKVVRMIGLDDKALFRQHNRLRADVLAPPLRAKYESQMSLKTGVATHPLFSDVGRWFMAGRPDLASKLSSLNQLYAAAAVANLFLVKRLKVWAEQSQGMLRVAGVEGDDQRFVEWSDLKNAPGAVRSACWSNMKRHSRAIEKLLRSYGNCPHLLMDVTRQCLVFHSMEQLTMCLGLMVTDDNVRVERLKNRMSPQYDSSETGGYRDVCINLRIISNECEQLGGEMHVCEVQLLLLQFATLKTTEGHQRYRIARNVRGT